MGRWESRERIAWFPAVTWASAAVDPYRTGRSCYGGHRHVWKCSGFCGSGLCTPTVRPQRQHPNGQPVGHGSLCMHLSHYLLRHVVSRSSAELHGAGPGRKQHRMLSVSQQSAVDRVHERRKDRSSRPIDYGIHYGSAERIAKSAWQKWPAVAVLLHEKGTITSILIPASKPQRSVW